MLHLSVNPTESAASWRLSLEDLKKRGVEEIDLVIADGVQGLEGEVFKIFPGSNLQKCVTHKKRGILLRTRPKEKQEMSEDLKEVFDNFDKDSSIGGAKDKLERYIRKWESKYPGIRRHFGEEIVDYYFTYLQYEASIRRYLYTSNGIENLNRQIRKATKHKVSFEKEDRLLDYIFVVVKDYERNNWGKYPVSHFSKISRQKNN